MISQNGFWIKLVIYLMSKSWIPSLSDECETLDIGNPQRENDPLL